MRTIIVDIDGTLSDAAWREGLRDGEGGWDAFHAAAGEDKAFAAMREFVDAFSASGHIVVAITGRNEKFRALTNDWLEENGFIVDTLLMRGNDDFRPAGDMKVAMAIEHFGSVANMRAEVILAVDDTAAVLDAFRAHGITTLLVVPAHGAV